MIKFVYDAGIAGGETPRDPAQAGLVGKRRMVASPLPDPDGNRAARRAAARQAGRGAAKGTTKSYDNGRDR